MSCFASDSEIPARVNQAPDALEVLMREMELPSVGHLLGGRTAMLLVMVGVGGGGENLPAVREAVNGVQGHRSLEATRAWRPLRKL